MNKAMENRTRLSKRDQLDVCPPLHRENSAKKRQVLTGESEMKPEMAIQAIKAKDENRESRIEWIKDVDVYRASDRGKAAMSRGWRSDERGRPDEPRVAWREREREKRGLMMRKKKTKTMRQRTEERERTRG